MRKNFEKYGPWALVTGASAGIGEEFTHQLAAKGLNIILIARREEKLASIASTLEEKYSIQTRIKSVDLTSDEFLKQIKTVCEGLDIRLVVSNAGPPSYKGHFLDRSIEEMERALTFNTVVQAKIVHHFSDAMAKSNGGGIILVSSISAYGPVPYMAEYSSSKSFQLAFGESLHYELKNKNIDILVLSPGATKTERIKHGMTVGPVVRAALNNLGKRASVLPGWKNNLNTFIGRYFKSRNKYLNDRGKLLERQIKQVRMG